MIPDGVLSTDLDRFRMKEAYVLCYLPEYILIAIWRIDYLELFICMYSGK